MDEEGAQGSSNGAHHAEDGQVPDIVEHAGAVQAQAVRVQAKIPVPPKMGLQHAGGTGRLLQGMLNISIQIMIS